MRRAIVETRWAAVGRRCASTCDWDADGAVKCVSVGDKALEFAGSQYVVIMWRISLLKSDTALGFFQFLIRRKGSFQSQVKEKGGFKLYDE